MRLRGDCRQPRILRSKPVLPRARTCSGQGQAEALLLLMGCSFLRMRSFVPALRSPAGLTTQVGSIRLAQLSCPKSDKPDFGWSIFFVETFCEVDGLAGSRPPP